jgi:hypothetical protein
METNKNHLLQLEEKDRIINDCNYIHINIIVKNN